MPPAPRTTARNILQRTVKRLKTHRVGITQLLLTALACTLAYTFADMIGSKIPMVAVGAALFAVSSNVTKSISHGLNTIGGTILAVGAAVLLLHWIGLNAVSVLLLVLVTIIVGRLLGLGRDGSLGAAATSVFVLGLGNAASYTAVSDRVIDTLLGVGIGVVVSSLIHPVSPEEKAKDAIETLSDQIAHLLAQLADGVKEGTYTKDQAAEWLKASRDLSELLAVASGAVAEAEIRTRWTNRNKEAKGLQKTLMALDHSCTQANAIARSLFDAAHTDRDQVVPEQLGEVLTRASEAFTVHADVVADDEHTAALEIVLDEVRSSRQAALKEVRNIDETGTWLLSSAVINDVDRMVDELAGEAPALKLAKEEKKKRLRRSR